MASANLNLTGYHLTFDDEFNSFTSSPNGSTGWATTAFGIPGGTGTRTPSSNEQEYYSDPSVGANPFSNSGGALTITATPGSSLPSGKTYTSGWISTQGQFAQSYGYFEMRAELPQGAGMWPAFWLYPSASYDIRELDVMEAFGATHNAGGGATQAHWGIHDNSLSGTQAGTWVTLPGGGNEYTGFHTYGMDWQPDYITYYIDGQQVAQTATPADMTAPMYMIANLAVGGSASWPGPASGETGEMKIDYIRAYSKNSTAPAKSLQQVSSPDGASTSLYGATASNLSSSTAMLPSGWNGSTSGGGGTTTQNPSSPNGTEIASVSASPIIDAQGNKWTLVNGGTSAGLQIAENGKVDIVTNHVGRMQFLEGSIYQVNSWGNWYSKLTAGGSWTQVPQPSVASANGSTMNSAGKSPLLDTQDNAWSLIQSAASGLQITKNGIIDALTANVTLLGIASGKIIQENSSGNWYSEPTSGGSWIQIPQSSVPPLHAPA